MTRLWQQLDRRGRLGCLLIAGLLFTAASADLLASALPLAVRWQGEVFLLPCLRHPVALQAESQSSLRQSLGPGDWLLATPIPYGPEEQAKGDAPLAAPSGQHWLGTDIARRDVAARLVHGSRVALVVGVGAAALYVFIGTLIGLLSAHFRGRVDAWLSQLTEVVVSVPAFFLVLALGGVLERSGLLSLIAVIGATYWTRVARLVRAEALRVETLPYIDAAVVLGFSPARVMFRHVLPNITGTILVSAAFGVASATPLEAALSFLGFGVADDTPSWGGLMRGALGNFEAWWLVLLPGAAVFSTTVAFILLAESLREVFDPRADRAGARLAAGPPHDRNP